MISCQRGEIFVVRKCHPENMLWTHVWTRGKLKLSLPKILVEILANRHEPRLRRRKYIGSAWAITEMESVFTRSLKINSSYEANERRRDRQRAPGFHYSLVSFLFVHFLLVNTFFPIFVDLLKSVSGFRCPLFHTIIFYMVTLDSILNRKTGIIK